MLTLLANHGNNAARKKRRHYQSVLEFIGCCIGEIFTSHASPATLAGGEKWPILTNSADSRKSVFTTQQINFFSLYDFLQSYRISQVLHTSFAALIDLCSLKKRAGKLRFWVGAGANFGRRLFLLRRDHFPIRGSLRFCRCSPLSSRHH